MTTMMTTTTTKATGTATAMATAKLTGTEKATWLTCCNKKHNNHNIQQSTKWGAVGG